MGLFEMTLKNALLPAVPVAFEDTGDPVPAIVVHDVIGDDVESEHGESPDGHRPVGVTVSSDPGGHFLDLELDAAAPVDLIARVGVADLRLQPVLEVMHESAPSLVGEQAGLAFGFRQDEVPLLDDRRVEEKEDEAVDDGSPEFLEEVGRERRMALADGVEDADIGMETVGPEQRENVVEEERVPDCLGRYTRRSRRGL